MTNLEKVHYFFRDYESPERFIDWNYHYIISSCLGRRVHFQKENPVFPNIFVVIVGPPAIGKTMPASKLGDMLGSLVEMNAQGQAVDLVDIVPDCVTLERLYQVIEKSTKIYRAPNGDPKVHSSVSFNLADEMALLFKNSEKMNDLTMFLNAGYDCKSSFKYETKRNGTNVIKNMCINFLGCCTPNWIAKNMSSNVLDDGWASRVFFIYGDTRRQLTTYYNFSEAQNKALMDIKVHCRNLSKLSGEVTFTPEALAYFDDWYQKHQLTGRINKDPKLDNYYGRKKLHIWKLAMIHHFGNSLSMTVGVESVKDAFRTAADAELDMHKALASININPTARLAEMIKRSIVSSNGAGMNRIELAARHFADIAQGGLASLDEAVGYLVLTDQITNTGGRYNLVRKILPVDFAKELMETTADQTEPISNQATQ